MPYKILKHGHSKSPLSRIWFASTSNVRPVYSSIFLSLANPSCNVQGGLRHANISISVVNAPASDCLDLPELSKVLLSLPFRTSEAWHSRSFLSVATTMTPEDFERMLEYGSSSAAKRQKISLACDPCRARKVRCDGNRPTCRQCTRGRKVYTCTYGRRLAETQQRHTQELQGLDAQLSNVEQLQSTRESANISATVEKSYWTWRCTCSEYWSFASIFNIGRASGYDIWRVFIFGLFASAISSSRTFSTRLHFRYDKQSALQTGWLH